MTGRPPLGLGEHGLISTKEIGRRQWLARTTVRDTDGKRRRVTAGSTTKSGSIRALTAKLESRVPPGLGGSKGPSADMLVSDMCATFLEARSKQTTTRAATGRRSEHQAQPRIRPQTLGAYAACIRSLVVPTIGDLQLREVTVGVLEDVLLDLDSTGLSTAQMRSVLNQVLRMALRYGAIRSNPMASVEPLQRQHREVESLDVAEVRLLRQLVRPEFVRTPGRRGPNHDLADVVDVSLGTGGRIGEVLAFRWEDLCWLDVGGGEMAPALRVAGTLVEPRRGYVANLYRQPYTKGGEGRRLIIPAHVHESLVSRRERQTACDASDPVFASRTGTWLWPNNLRTRLRAAIANTELVGTSPHTLRRTVGTAVGHAMGLEAAREQLGHRHPGVTPRHYVANRLVGPDVRRVLDAFFDEAPQG